MKLFEGCQHTKTELTGYSYPTAKGWMSISFKQCKKCGDVIENTRKEKFSKDKPIKKKR